MTARDRAIRQLWATWVHRYSCLGCEYLIQHFTLTIEIQDAQRAYAAFAQTDYR